MDETSAAKGHDYVSVFMAMDSRGVPFATRGKDGTVSAFAEDVAAHGGDPGKIARTSSGMSAAFIPRGPRPLAERADDLRPVPLHKRCCPKRSTRWPEGSWLSA